MHTLPSELELIDLPAHVASWSAAGISGFVLGVLKRWQRNHGELPHRFSLIVCPQVEINALGGLPPQVKALTDPRLRCRHFTGCHKPYFVVIFTDPDAEDHRAAVQSLLPWSEGYVAELSDTAVRLLFRDATEEIDAGCPDTEPSQRLQELLATGELISILS